MSLYSESLSFEALEKVLVAITNCVKLASKFEGRVFGGFVRGVVVPRRFDAQARVHYKDVDLWFPNQEQADAFTRTAGLIPAHVGEKCLSATQQIYKFGREQYHLVHNDLVLAWIDVVISPTIPVNDFNVNRLTVRYDDSGAPIFESFGPETVDTLMESILHKKAEMLSDYLPLVRSVPFHYRRIKGNYLDHGWAVTYQEVTLPKDADYNWLRNFSHRMRVEEPQRSKSKEIEEIERKINLMVDL